MWAAAVSTAIGVWIYVSPSVIGYEGAAEASDRIAGALIITFSFVAIWEFLRGARKANRPLALWLVAASWFLEQPTAGVVSSVVAGAAVLALSFVEGEIERPYGGGWSVVWRDVGSDR